MDRDGKSNKVYYTQQTLIFPNGKRSINKVTANVKIISDLYDIRMKMSNSLSENFDVIAIRPLNDAVLQNILQTLAQTTSFAASPLEDYFDILILNRDLEFRLKSRDHFILRQKKIVLEFSSSFSRASDSSSGNSDGDDDEEEEGLLTFSSNSNSKKMKKDKVINEDEQEHQRELFDHQRSLAAYLSSGSMKLRIPNAILVSKCSSEVPIEIDEKGNVKMIMHPHQQSMMQQSKSLSKAQSAKSIDTLTQIAEDRLGVKQSIAKQMVTTSWQYLLLRAENRKRSRGELLFC